MNRFSARSLTLILMGGMVGIPAFAATWQPSRDLGHLEETFQGDPAVNSSLERRPSPVILIQDTPANYSVQKKVIGLLNVLAGPKDRMVLGVQAPASGLALLQREELSTQSLLADHLLQDGGLSGAQYLAWKFPQTMIAKSLTDAATPNGAVFGKSLEARVTLAKEIDILRDAVHVRRADAPAELQALWHLEEGLQLGNIDLAQLADHLHVQSIADYSHAMAAIEDRKTVVLKRVPAESLRLAENLIAADGHIDLLTRLFHEDLRFPDLANARTRIPAILNTVETFVPGQNLTEWRQSLEHAFDYYAVALLGSQSVVDHAMDLVRQHPAERIVLVTDHFHTTSIASALRAQGVAYEIVRPVVESRHLKDECIVLHREAQQTISGAVNVSMPTPLPQNVALLPD